MSGPMRFRAAAVLVLAAVSSSPASANIIDTLFNRTPEEPAAPAPVQDASAKDASAKEECLSRPGKPADGQHWMYRLDGHRRCWFMVPEEAATVRKRVRYHAARRRLAASAENDAAPRKQKAVVDARAELIRPEPEETLQPRPVPAVKVVDAAPSVRATGAPAIPATAAAAVPAAGAAQGPATGAAALVPPPPVLAKPDQLPADRPNVAKDNVETLLAATSASSEAVAVSAPSATPVAFPFVVISEDEPWWTSRWLGPLLMVLGLISLLIATRPVGMTALLARRSRAPGPEEPLNTLSDFDPQTHPHHGRHAPALRHGERQIAQHQWKARPSGPANPEPANPEMAFQEAIRMLTDFDAASIGARPGALTRRVAAAPITGKTGARVYRTS